MFFDPINILYGTIFIGVLLLVEGLYYLIHDLRGGNNTLLNRRMRMIASGTDTRTTLRSLKREVKDPLTRALGSILPSIDELITHSGSTMSVARLISIMLVIWGFVFSLMETMTPAPPYITLFSASLIAIGGPYLYLVRKKSARLQRFGDQLPDSLDLIVRGLRAGHPVSSALSMVATEMADPIGSEIGLVVDEMTYGLDLGDALNNLAERVPHDDLKFLVVTIQIQYMVGGNLAEVLGSLSQVIRNRHQMFAKIRAVTAEGRASAVIIGILPMAFAAFMVLMNPDFFKDVTGDPLFWPLIGAGVMLMLMGQFVIYKLVNFKL